MPWLSRFKVIRCFLSDKARALLKLAKTSLSVDHVPDLFHMMNDVSKVMRFSFHRLKSNVKKLLISAEKQLSQSIDVTINKGIIATLLMRLQLLSIRQMDYQKNLRRLSTALHPFVVLSRKRQNSASVEELMRASLNRIKRTKDELEITDSGKKLERVERQIPDAAKQVDLWWQWVNTSLESADLTAELKDWLLNYLLPFAYWKSRLNKTNSKKIKRFYQWSMMIAEKKLSAHPLTAELLSNNKPSEWQTWAEQMSKLFIRATSAIEGRNGWLSQIHFNGRGLSAKRIQSQTAIHNYYLKRSDGTTACERLSSIKPDDMFEFIIQNIGSLADPRKSKTKEAYNALILKAVPP